MFARVSVILMLVFSMLIVGNNIPVLAEETDDLCKTFCTDKEKFGDKYKSGRMKPADGQCSEKETEQDLCCCQ